MIGRSVLPRAATVLASFALFACSVPAEVDDGSGTAEGAIINGSPATDAKYAAVGALVWVLPGVGVVDAFCSGTLVATRAIVTARHCTPLIDAALQGGLVPAFALGADAFQPVQVVPITSYVTAAPSPTGGLLKDGGRDVAVARLESAPANVKPIKLALFQNSMLGKSFQIAGYGIRDAQGTYGQKYAGSATARAIKGRWYELLFKGSYLAYRNWYFTDSPGAARTEQEAKQWWDSYKLEDNYELLAGGLRGESVGCNGDSGGPLLMGSTASSIAIYGVNFAVENTISTGCGLGAGYLVFNQKMLDFVRTAAGK